MSREPIALYILRFVSIVLLAVFFAMLYWSSLLIEEDVKQIKENIVQIKAEISQLKRLPRQQSAGGEAVVSHVPAAERTQMKADLPNLLSEDPFSEITLPKLLGEGFVPHGTFHSATLGKPDNLHPFGNFREISNWIGMCSGSLARQHFGFWEKYAPSMALKVEERPNIKNGGTEYWVHLRDGVYWEPLTHAMFPADFSLGEHFLTKHQVTAEDFKFYYDALMNPFNQEPGVLASRAYFGDIEQIEIIDPLTFVVRWKVKKVEIDGQLVTRARYISRQVTLGLTPLASFLYKYFPDGKKIVEDDADPETYRNSSVWAQNFARHWAKNIIPSCGGWVFESMSDRELHFSRNADYFEPLGVLADTYVIEFKDSTDNIWQSFKAGKLDSYSLSPEQLLDYEQFIKSPLYKQQEAQGQSIERLDYLARSYFYVGWNMARPYFSSKKVRQAMTMAIDRERIIRDYLNGMGIEITGTFFFDSPSYDHSIQPLPYDPTLAKRYLAEEGWFDTDGDGVIDKVINGKATPFRFTLTYFVKNATIKAICEYIATALKEVGVSCSLNGVDLADLSHLFDDKNFDAMSMGWALGSPPEEPRQLWHSSGAKEKGSSNAVGFANAEADKIIEELEYEYNAERRIALYHQFDKILYDEQPYTFIYSPKSALLYRSYLQNVFIPSERQDLIPGATVSEPSSSIFWLKKG